MKLAGWQPSPAAAEAVAFGAQSLGVTHDDLVIDAVQAYLEARRRERQERVRQGLRNLDGSVEASVALLTGMSRERLRELGGVGE